MKLTNHKIYEYAEGFRNFTNCNIKLPIKINFFLQKNINTVLESAQEIEQARISIAQQLGTLDDDKINYIIPSDKISLANQELNDLFNLEQDLPIHIFKLSEFDGIELTYQQMSAIMFMIEE